MVDPVQAADGYTYERMAITKWLRPGRMKSPITGEILLSRSVTPDTELASAIKRFRAENSLPAEDPVTDSDLTFAFDIRETELAKTAESAKWQQMRESLKAKERQIRNLQQEKELEYIIAKAKRRTCLAEEGHNRALQENRSLHIQVKDLHQQVAALREQLSGMAMLKSLSSSLCAPSPDLPDSDSNQDSSQTYFGSDLATAKEQTTAAKNKTAVTKERAKEKAMATSKEQAATAKEQNPAVKEPIKSKTTTIQEHKEKKQQTKQQQVKVESAPKKPLSQEELDKGKLIDELLSQMDTTTSRPNKKAKGSSFNKKAIPVGKEHAGRLVNPKAVVDVQDKQKHSASLAMQAKQMRQAVQQETLAATKSQEEAKKSRVEIHSNFEFLEASLQAKQTATTGVEDKQVAEKEPMPVKRCGFCNSTAQEKGRTELFKCGRCKALLYCSAACQRQHWQTHKRTCQQMQTPPPTLPAVLPPLPDPASPDGYAAIAAAAAAVTSNPEARNLTPAQLVAKVAAAVSLGGVPQQMSEQQPNSSLVVQGREKPKEKLSQQKGQQKKELQKKDHHQQQQQQEEEEKPWPDSSDLGQGGLELDDEQKRIFADLGKGGLSLDDEQKRIAAKHLVDAVRAASMTQQMLPSTLTSEQRDAAQVDIFQQNLCSLTGDSNVDWNDPKFLKILQNGLGGVLAVLEDGNLNAADLSSAVHSTVMHHAQPGQPTPSQTETGAGVDSVTANIHQAEADRLSQGIVPRSERHKHAQQARSSKQADLCWAEEEGERLWEVYHSETSLRNPKIYSEAKQAEEGAFGFVSMTTSQAASMLARHEEAFRFHPHSSWNLSMEEKQARLSLVAATTSAAAAAALASRSKIPREYLSRPSSARDQMTSFMGKELECAADAIGKLVKQLRDDIEPMVASKEELQLLTRAEKDRRIAKYLSPTTEIVEAIDNAADCIAEVVSQKAVVSAGKLAKQWTDVLSQGGIAEMYRDLDPSKEAHTDRLTPILQVVSVSRIVCRSKKEHWQIIVSDGTHYVPCVTTPEMNHKMSYLPENGIVLFEEFLPLCVPVITNDEHEQTLRQLCMVMKFHLVHSGPSQILLTNKNATLLPCEDHLNAVNTTKRVILPTTAIDTLTVELADRGLEVAEKKVLTLLPLARCNLPPLKGVFAEKAQQISEMTENKVQKKRKKKEKAKKKAETAAVTSAVSATSATSAANASATVPGTHEEGDTTKPKPLIVKAALKGDLRLVKVLLKRSPACINETAADGVTALEISAGTNHLDMLKTLLRAAANVNTIDSQGCSPLAAACDSLISSKFGVGTQSSILAVINTLVQSKADPNTVDRGGSSPLFLLCQSVHQSAVATLIDAKANVQYKRDGISLLCVVAENSHSGSSALATLLIKAGCCVNDIREADGVGPLFLASQAGNLPMCKLLIKHKAHLNPSLKSIPLTAAVGQTHLPVMKYLLECKADIEAKREAEGASALVVVSNFCNEQRGQDAMELLLNAKADVNSTTNKCATALMIASENGSLPVVKRLLAAKANINQPVSWEVSALVLAVGHGRNTMVEFLLENKAEVDQVADPYGNTALLCATRAGNTRMVELLLAHKANVNQKMLDGTTALHTVCQKGFVEIAKLLVDRPGINLIPELAGQPRMTPKQIADQNRLAVLQMQEAGADEEASRFLAISELIAAATERSAPLQ